MKRAAYYSKDVGTWILNYWLSKFNQISSITAPTWVFVLTLSACCNFDVVHFTSTRMLMFTLRRIMYNIVYSYVFNINVIWFYSIYAISDEISSTGLTRYWNKIITCRGSKPSRNKLEYSMSTQFRLKYEISFVRMWEGKILEFWIIIIIMYTPPWDFLSKSTPLRVFVEHHCKSLDEFDKLKLTSTRNWVFYTCICGEFLVKNHSVHPSSAYNAVRGHGEVRQ